MAGCGRRCGLSLADAGLIAATLDNVTSPQARWPALSSDHREVLERVAIAGDSYHEVSKRLNLPLGTLRARLHRARNALRSV
ncbi:sigma factor-like helix-turn-helix DNA-binding protein [Inquilinus sp. OTU3971]|uniref:sigma factor-like helix-turn-helix DNA-binding protein n=1 Tax=Inquilinus sp. OTU3971 TaxID=3043855 RepID=UPI00406CFB84